MAESESSGKLPEKLPEHDRQVLEKDTDDAQASAEAIQLGSGKKQRDLKQEATEKNHDRQQKFLDVFEGLLIWGLILGALLIALLAIVLVFHLIAPCSFRFLSEEEVSRIKDILAGGVFVTLISEQTKKRLR